MDKLRLLILAVLCQSAIAGEDEKQDSVLGQWHPLKAEYMIHSGGTAYSEPPTRTDRAISLYIVGQPARQLFDQIGPDTKEACGQEQSDRERRNKGVLCQYSARLDGPSDSHYRCWIGIDLRTGAGQVRTSC